MQPSLSRSDTIPLLESNMATTEIADSGRSGNREPPDDPPEKIALEWMPRIEKMAAGLCRRRYLSREETQDFIGDLQCKILDHDYAVVRDYKGKSGLAFYFRAVVANFFRDWQNHRWGKWRPSAEAKRMGPVGILLDSLLTRDGLPFPEACRMLRDNLKVPQSEAELTEMAIQLPRRSLRRFEGEERLESMAAGELDPEEQFLRQERWKRKCRALQALAKARSTLPPEDRPLVRLRYEKGLSVADIARGQNLKQRALYDRMERIQRHLRLALEREGIRREDVVDLLTGEDDDEH
jgi:RNA polymerase sigma factor (sigma-70 family)